MKIVINSPSNIKKKKMTMEFWLIISNYSLLSH